MMTEQEAIERLTAIVEFCSGGCENATLHGKPLSQDDEEIRQLNFFALELAISALEKQIGKKPIREKWDCFACPACGSGDVTTVDDRGETNGFLKFCGNCGQAICWDVKEDEDGK